MKVSNCNKSEQRRENELQLKHLCAYNILSLAACCFLRDLCWYVCSHVFSLFSCKAAPSWCWGMFTVPHLISFLFSISAPSHMDERLRTQYRYLSVTHLHRYGTVGQRDECDCCSAGSAWFGGCGYRNMTELELKRGTIFSHRDWFVKIYKSNKITKFSSDVKYITL